MTLPEFDEGWQFVAWSLESDHSIIDRVELIQRQTDLAKQRAARRVESFREAARRVAADDALIQLDRALGQGS